MNHTPPLHLDLPRTLFGAGSRYGLAVELADLSVKRPLLVTDRGVVAAGILDSLEDRGRLAWAEVFDGVTANPVFSDVDAGLHRYVVGECDGVVALGGGSVIDVAKYIALLAANGGIVADYTAGPTPHRRCAPLIAIPTTAGTGSEASPDAGIHPDSQTASVGMSSRHIIPDLAILDPELTVTMPERLTMATGIDAISHCVEAYLSVNSTPLTDTLLTDGITRAIRNLGVLAKDPANVEARGEMQLAAYVGGMGIGLGLGPAHAIAITCGEQGFHHGVLSGIGMVCSLDALQGVAPGRFPALQSAFGIESKESLSRATYRLMRTLGLPANLAELGYAASDPAALGRMAHASPFNFTARAHFSAEVFAGMVESSLCGQFYSGGVPAASAMRA